MAYQSSASRPTHPSSTATAAGTAVSDAAIIPQLSNIEDAGGLYQLVIDDVLENVRRQFESYGWDPSEIQRKLQKFHSLWTYELDACGAVSKINDIQRKATIPHLATSSSASASVPTAPTVSNTPASAATSSSSSGSGSGKKATGKRKAADAASSSSTAPPSATHSQSTTPNANAAPHQIYNNISTPTYQLSNSMGIEIPPNPYEQLPEIPKYLTTITQSQHPSTPHHQQQISSTSSSSSATLSTPQPHHQNGAATSSDKPTTPHVSSSPFSTNHALSTTSISDNGKAEFHSSSIANESDGVGKSSDTAASSVVPTVVGEAMPPFIDERLVNQRTDLDSELLGTQDDDVDDVDEPTENLILCTYDKVNHKKDKWRCNLAHGIMVLNHRDYVFSKAVGDFNWS